MGEGIVYGDMALKVPSIKFFQAMTWLTYFEAGMENSVSLFHSTNEAVSMYRTSNQTYGSRAPTAHEMPVSASHICQDKVPSGRADPHVVNAWHFKSQSS